MGLIEEFVERAGPLFEDVGYAIIATAVVLERSIFIGLIVPGDVILALGGVYAARGQLGLGWVIFISALAAGTGESIGYWLGRRYGAGLIARLPFVRRLASRLDAAQEYFAQHGGKTVAFGRFATVAGAFIPFVAGVARMPYGRFLVVDLAAIAVWASGITMIGYLFGSNIDLVERVVRRFGLTMLLILIAFIVGRTLIRRGRTPQPPP